MVDTTSRYCFWKFVQCLTMIGAVMLIFALEACSVKSNQIYPVFSQTRFSPDGASLIFNLCDPNSPDGCRIHVYNLETNTLSYYLPPPGQLWEDASYSDTGDQLVLVVSPIGDPKRSVSQRHELLPKTQIATMDVDG